MNTDIGKLNTVPMILIVKSDDVDTIKVRSCSASVGLLHSLAFGQRCNFSHEVIT
jgi:hypothetical protein